MDSKRKPSVPNPKIFQIPKTSNKAIIIKPPNGSNKTSVSRGSNEHEWPTPSPLKNDTNQEQRLPRTLHSREDDCGPAAEPHALNSGISSCPSTSADISVDNGHTPFSRNSFITSKWRPDVFVQAFVPQAFLAVNNAPAKSIISTSVEGINFPKYIAAFASPTFLPPPFCSEKTPSISHLPLLAADDLDCYNYERHFIDCVLLDLEAQTPEVRSHDLFGVQLHVVAQIHHIYSLHVPGIRESAPRVAYGDIVMLRQLILDSRTSLPQGMDFWVASGNRERGLPAPGFTGYEIAATVVAVDMKLEKLHLRAEGVSTSIPLMFNVSFVVQGHRVRCLQHTIADIANELTSREVSFRCSSNPRAEEMVYTSSPDVKSNGWLRRMLFPHESDGRLLKGFPSGNFKQTWYDSDLNYEQMYLINGPPGTGKTKTVVEAVTKLANDLDFIGAILVCAPSDPAADILALRLKRHFENSQIIRLNEFSRTFAEVPQELLPYCYIEDKVFNLPPLPTLMSYRIVVATCRGAEMLHQARLTNRDLIALQKNVTSILQSTSEAQKSTPLHWTALFVDEAAQAIEPEILIPLAVVAPHESRSCHPDPIFAMAGDQHQLGPRTYDNGTALHISLFERLSSSPTYASHPQSRSKSRTKCAQNRTIHPFYQPYP
ncbi:RNA helicase SDE3 [Physcia stellaris]|nr:RNA helicase SDE3 [Physcia stellaris]